MSKLKQIDWIEEQEEKEKLVEWLEEEIPTSFHQILPNWSRDWREVYLWEKIDDLERKLKAEKRTFSRLLKKLGGK